MSKNKTTATETNVDDFISAVKDETKKNDCFQLIEIISKLTDFKAIMWGPSIVGFGSYHYKYDSGREGDSPLFAFSPRSSSIALYFSANFDKRNELLEKLGKHKTEKGCVHIKSIKDINIEILQLMITKHLEHMKDLYPTAS